MLTTSEKISIKFAIGDVTLGEKKNHLTNLTLVRIGPVLCVFHMWMKSN